MGSKVYTLETVTNQDQRVQVGGNAGSIISPGAAVGGTGAITAAPNSQVHQTITSTGYKATDVQQLLDSMFAETGASRQAVEDLAGSLGSGLQEQSKALTSALSATRAPEQSALSSLVPVLIVGIVALMIWGNRR